MANTFVKIQTITAGSGGTSSFDFTSIPQTYTDLKIFVSVRSTLAQIYGAGSLQFNSDTGSNYIWRRIGGQGVGVGSDLLNPATSIIYEFVGANSTASIFANAEIYIPNYTVASQKSVSIDSVGENNATEAYQTFTAGKWTNTAAITSIKLFSLSQTIVQYSTATLYGIKSS
jgi:hypothetical protein